DQDIELAITLHGHLDGMAPVLFVRDVQMHIHGGTTAGVNLCFDLPALRIAYVAKHDLGAFAGECFGLCSPLPPCATANQCHFPVQLPHTPPSSYCPHAPRSTQTL